MFVSNYNKDNYPFRGNVCAGGADPAVSPQPPLLPTAQGLMAQQKLLLCLAKRENQAYMEPLLPCLSSHPAAPLLLA